MHISRHYRDAAGLWEDDRCGERALLKEHAGVSIFGFGRPRTPWRQALGLTTMRASASTCCTQGNLQEGKNVAVTTAHLIAGVLIPRRREVSSGSRTQHRELSSCTNSLDGGVRRQQQVSALLPRPTSSVDLCVEQNIPPSVHEAAVLTR